MNKQQKIERNRLLDIVVKYLRSNDYNIKEDYNLDDVQEDTFVKDLIFPICYKVIKEKMYCVEVLGKEDEWKSLNDFYINTNEDGYSMIDFVDEEGNVIMNSTSNTSEYPIIRLLTIATYLINLLNNEGHSYSLTTRLDKALTSIASKQYLISEKIIKPDIKVTIVDEYNYDNNFIYDLNTIVNDIVRLGFDITSKNLTYGGFESLSNRCLLLLIHHYFLNKSFVNNFDIERRFNQVSLKSSYNEEELFDKLSVKNNVFSSYNSSKSYTLSVEFIYDDITYGIKVSSSNKSLLNYLLCKSLITVIDTDFKHVLDNKDITDYVKLPDNTYFYIIDKPHIHEDC